MSDKKKTDASGMTRKEFNKERRVANKGIKSRSSSRRDYRNSRLRRKDFGDITISNTPEKSTYRDDYDEKSGFGKGGILKQHD